MNKRSNNKEFQNKFQNLSQFKIKEKKQFKIN